jgi:glycosyltransferase involved in cell wall biosynthesis
MKNLVTIGLPIYKRLHYLPHVLSAIRAQDYPFIELLVSDNGMNGRSVMNVVADCYDKPFRIRQNTSTVSISTHFNQIIGEASGEYFLLLADDDEISSNYVSELVGMLQQHPEGAVGIAKQEILNEAGSVIKQSKETLPDFLSGPDFIRAAWHTNQYGFDCFATFLSKTEDLKQCGGYPDFTKGTNNDNALLIKLCLNKYVVFSNRCAFRWRVYESSLGWSLSIEDLAKASREFLQFLDSDPVIAKYVSAHRAEWRAIKNHLIKMAWETYLWRWQDMYRKRLPCRQWVKAAFAMPFIPAYYRKVTSILLEAFIIAARSKTKKMVLGDRTDHKQTV